MADRERYAVSTLKVLGEAWIKTLKVGGNPASGVAGVEVTGEMLETLAEDLEALATLLGIEATLTGLAENSELLTAVAAKLATLPAAIDFTVGTEADDTITVSLQVKNHLDAALTGPLAIMGYFSDAADGDGVTDTPPEYGVTVNGDARLMTTDTLGAAFVLVTDADGAAELVLRDSGAKTLYLAFATPLGELVVSDAITWS